MSYNHLNTFERTRIEVLSKMGYSTRQIAQQLNRHHSTIARELKRNTQQTYQAELADELAEREKYFKKFKEQSRANKENEK